MCFTLGYVDNFLVYRVVYFYIHLFSQVKIEIWNNEVHYRKQNANTSLIF